MAQQVRGVIAPGKNEPVRVETIVVPDPGPGEAVVKIQACGVCHTDLHYKQGGINDDFPFLLGHEAAGVVESVGDGVTDVAPGDFVVLNWRAVCGQCRACLRGRPWYCFDTHNAKQKMTLAGRHRALARRSASARSPRRPSSPPASAPRSTPRSPRRSPDCSAAASWPASAPPSTPARSAAATPSPSSAAAASATRRSPAPALAGRGEDHRGRHRRPQAGDGEEVRRHPHRQLPLRRPRRGHPRTDRRLRRRRRHRGGRPPGDLQAGVLRPRPRRHRRPRRRPHAGDEARTAAARRVRPRRLAQVVLVRRLPALARLPDARSTCTSRAGWTSTRSSPRRSSSATSRRRSPGCTTVTSCARWWCSDGRPHRPAGHLRHVLPRRRHLGRRQQRLDRRRRHRGRRHRRRPRRRRDPRRARRPHAARHRLHARAQRPHRRRARARRRDRRADPAAPRRPAAVGADPPRPRPRRRARRRPGAGRRRHAS